ncbi:hypothetical protein AMTR_s00103p00140020 [Amborella trichopoda]|uniref:Uncharacterized protein n=1 Tax=Amborella trichopoda TaxID=13333 RepID=W1NTL5_AMBTC|nr:hypothetical protein AMTR_s00103p00140020 [Amborella trichopoda]
MVSHFFSSVPLQQICGPDIFGLQWLVLVTTKSNLLVSPPLISRATSEKPDAKKFQIKEMISSLDDIINVNFNGSS